MTCDEHEGVLVLNLPLYEPGARPTAALTAELVVCDKCGVLFMPPGAIEAAKARQSARMLLAQQPSLPKDVSEYLRERFRALGRR